MKVYGMAGVARNTCMLAGKLQWDQDGQPDGKPARESANKTNRKAG